MSLVNMMKTDKMRTVLIVDDDQTICDFVREILDENGYVCEIALNADDALVKIQNHDFDVALLDIILPDRSGMDLLEGLHSFHVTTSAIMMTAVKDLDTAVQAMKMGASDYLVKPLSIDKLITSITTALENRNKHDKIIIKTQKTGATNQSISAINAIAIGVDAHVDYFDLHSKIVTEKTVDLAKKLGLPDKEIKKWEIMRNKILSQRISYIKYILGKLERSQLAQVILGLTNSIIRFPQARAERN
jgi:two-component system response regulator AtoC